MHKSKIISSFIVLGLCVASIGAAAENLESFDVPFGRSLAIGGRHVALADDFSAILANPASLVAIPRQLYVSQVGLLGTGPIFDIASAMIAGGDAMEAVSDILANNRYKLFVGAEAPGPIAFGYAGAGLGFGLFNRSKASLNAASASSIKVSASEDILLVGGYAVRVELGNGNTLDLGLEGKGFIRGEAAPTLGALELQTLLDDPMLLLDKPFKLTTGVGVDAGMRWAWNERIAVGLSCRDAYSPGLVTTYTSLDAFLKDPASAAMGEPKNGTIAPDLALGLKWSPYLGGVDRFMDSFVIALDYGDLLDLLDPLPRNPVLNIGLGIEARFLDILYLRAGFYETLLSAGAGLDLGLFRLNLAAFGKELGREPGDRTVYDLLLSFEFRY